MKIKVGLRFVVDTDMYGTVYTISTVVGSSVIITWDGDTTTYQHGTVTKFLKQGDWIEVDYIKPRKISKQHKF